MKFIHAADIHLDSPLCGLARYEGAPVEQMQTATRKALMNLVQVACQEAVDFVLLAGDLYDGDWRDYNTGLFFHQQMVRLREANIPVFIVHGNHDASNTITKQLRLPENVTEFNAQTPQTVVLEKLGVAIHGQSFADRTVTEDLSARYPSALAGYFNIGLLHTSLNGREGHATYAPCTLTRLLNHGYDYWALGHIHKREIIHENPYIVFPGNLQGRHARETGAKGCTLVQVSPEKTVTLTHLAMDVLRWDVCQLTVDDLTQPEELIDRARWAVSQALEQAEGRVLALRFVVAGECPVHAELQSNSERWINEIRATATDVGIGNVWVEKVLLDTRATYSTMIQEEGPLGELVDTLRTFPEDNMNLQALMAELRHFKQALPAEAHANERGRTIDPENPDTLRLLLNQVEEFLLARLLAYK